MPPLTQQENSLVAKLKQLKALQDAQAQSRARKAAAPAVHGRPAVSGARPVVKTVASNGPTPKASAPAATPASAIPGETPHQRALRLLKSKQAAGGGGGGGKAPAPGRRAAPSKAAAERAPAAAPAKQAKPLPGASQPSGPQPVQRRPSLKRPNVKRHAPAPPAAAAAAPMAAPAAAPAPSPTEPIPTTAAASPPPSPRYDPSAAAAGSTPEKEGGFSEDDGPASPSSPPAKVARRDGGPRSGRSALGTTLFIGDLPLGTESHELQAWFEAFGAVVNVRVLSNYGFVTYEDSEVAAEAHAALQMDAQPMTVHGRTLRVDYAKGPGNAGAGREEGGGRGGRYAERPPPRAPQGPGYKDHDTPLPWGVDDRDKPGGYQGPEEVAAYRPPPAEEEPPSEEADRAAVVYDDL
eukprot:jgi/Tetstr1/466250/TSEL_010806.t1